MDSSSPTDSSRVYLIDLDGTLIRGGRAMPGATALLQRLQGRFAVISNNSSHTPARLSTHLAELGLEVPATHLILAGAAAIDWIAARLPRARVLIAGSGALSGLARRARLRPVAHDPQVILLARDARFTYARLQELANMARAGAVLVVANPDLTHPDDDGRVVPETGALLQALLACTGPIPHHIVGKPEPILYELALRRLGAAPAQALVIGDNPATDAAGAARLGIAHVIVGDHADAAFPDLHAVNRFLSAPSRAGHRISTFLVEQNA